MGLGGSQGGQTDSQLCLKCVFSTVSSFGVCVLCNVVYIGYNGVCNALYGVCTVCVCNRVCVV